MYTDFYIYIYIYMYIESLCGKSVRVEVPFRSIAFPDLGVPLPEALRNAEGFVR